MEGCLPKTRTEAGIGKQPSFFLYTTTYANLKSGRIKNLRADEPLFTKIIKNPSFDTFVGGRLSFQKYIGVKMS